MECNYQELPRPNNELFKKSINWMIMLNKAVHVTPADEVNDPLAERLNKWWNRSLCKRTRWKSFTRARWGPAALRTAAACARHNYIMRCTLAQRTCGARDPVNARVPMGTSNEMVVTVSHPAKVVARRDVHAGGCALLSRGDDTGPPEPPMAFVNTSNMLPLDEPSLMRMDLWEPKCWCY